MNPTRNPFYRDIVPPQMTRWMSYVDDTILRNNVGNRFMCFRLRANDIYDPEPTIGGGTVAGFAALGTLYRKFRVIAVSIEWTATNQEAFPMGIGCICSNVDLSAAVTSAVIAGQVLENPMATGYFGLSPSGGLDHRRITKEWDLGIVWGNKKEYLLDQSFEGTLGSAPASPTAADILYLNFIMITAVNMTVAGLHSALRIRYLVKLYSRQGIDV